MPFFSQKQLDIIPSLVDSRLNVVGSWFDSQVPKQHKTLFAGLLSEIRKGLSPIYDPDPGSLHRCVGTVKFYIERAIKTKDESIEYLTKLISMERLDTLYLSLKTMTEANPNFLEIEQMHLSEERTELFKGFQFDYIAPENRLAPKIEHNEDEFVSQLRSYVRKRKEEADPNLGSKSDEQDILSHHYKNTFFCIKFGFSAKEKIDAVEHLIKLLEKNNNAKVPPLSEKEQRILNSSRVSKIVSLFHERYTEVMKESAANSVPYVKF